MFETEARDLVNTICMLEHVYTQKVRVAVEEFMQWSVTDEHYYTQQTLVSAFTNDRQVWTTFDFVSFEKSSGLALGVDLPSCGARIT